MWWEWLRHNEWLPLWTGGMVLILIFIWDRRDSRRLHREIMEQIGILKQQSQFALNSERAWITADIRYQGEERPCFIGSVTNVFLQVDIRNDGRTPAWIDAVSIGMEIAGHELRPETAILECIQPLPAEKSWSMDVPMACRGIPKLGHEILQVHATIAYRDIFKSHTLVLVYHIEPVTGLLRRFSQNKINPLSPEAWLKK
jgi:hypothetical protein